ncbi:MAG: 8-amino-7-oxononanoate synthase [Fuerstiella sp.]|nr:8-amino-7-oxononanoate synthase [Fuerstiella sp.]
MERSLKNALQHRLLALEKSGRRRFARQVESLARGRCIIDGQELINFGSNDYLSLAHDPRVCAAFSEAASRQSGATASGLIAGRSRLHAELENQLAEFEGCEAALLYPTGFAANLGTIQAFVRPGDVIFSEQDNHASLIDAVRGTKAAVSIYSRSDLNALVAQIRTMRPDCEFGFLVTDGVFSMDGSVAPLRELCDIADEFHLAVIVDEAHGTGVIGPNGRGACEFSGVQSRPFVHIGTLSKALGCLGGFVTGSRVAIEWLRNRARTQFFSTALPPAVCAAALQSLQIVQSEPKRRTALLERNQLARSCARSVGLTVIGHGEAPILAVTVPGDKDIMAISRQLQHDGWFVPAIRPPTVPNGSSRFRISLTVSHEPDDIVAVLHQIAELTR